VTRGPKTFRSRGGWRDRGVGAAVENEAQTGVSVPHRPRLLAQVCPVVQSNVAQTLLSVLLLRSRCARAHLSCRNAARSVRTRTPAVSQCCAVGAHVHACHVAMLRPTRRCACGGVAVLHLRVFVLRLLTPRLSLPIFLATTSRIVRFSMLAAVGGMGVLDST